MTIYAVTKDNVVTEFNNEADARAFIAMHGGLYSEYEQTLVVRPRLPDVTPRQLRKTLFINGITEDQILGAINSVNDPDKTIALIEWEYSIKFERNHELVDTIGAMLNLNADQIDELWNFALTQ